MGVANPISIGTLSAFTGAPANSCLPYSYDLNGDGTLDTSAGITDERFGYRLRQGVVQVRRGSQGCTTSSSGWTDVTTASLIEVTTLLFTVSTTTNLGVSERAAVVNIGGRLVADNTITRSLSRTVRLRNDGYTP
jgi:prepilin peptidase dependent protein B